MQSAPSLSSIPTLKEREVESFMKKSLNKFIKGYMEVLYALSSVFYIGFCFCVLPADLSASGSGSAFR